MALQVIRALVTVASVVAVAGSAVVANAAGASSPKVTATVTKTSATEQVVHIVNRDGVTYRKFIVETQNKPVLVAVNKPCAIERDLGFIGTVYRYRYRAVCKKAVAPGKTFDIRLTTKGSGRVNVFVVLKDVLFRVSK